MRLIGSIGLLALVLLAAAPGSTAASASTHTWPAARHHVLQRRTTPGGFLPPRQWTGRPQPLVSSRVRERGRAATSMSAVGEENERRRRQLEEQHQATRPVPEFVAEANKKIVSSIKGA